MEEDDEVVATDPETGRRQDREITRTHRHEDTDLTALRVTVAAGQQTAIETPRTTRSGAKPAMTGSTPRTYG